MSQASSHEGRVGASSQGSTNTNPNAYTNSISASDVSTSELLHGTSLQNSYHAQSPPSSPEQQRMTTHSAHLPQIAYGSDPVGHPELSELTLQRRESTQANTVSLNTDLTHSGYVDAGRDQSQTGTNSTAESAPYYDISNYSRSINTLDLLQSYEANQLAEFVRNRPQTIRNSAISQEGSVAQISEQFNQVPRRFSQFIVDQSHALGPPATSSNASGSVRSRDISLSMGSQATIFSVQSAEQLRRRNFSTNPRSVLEDACESSSSLGRRKAIRCKKGGKLYRLRLQMRKLAFMFKRKLGAMRSFFARPKKATSKVRTPSDRPFFRRSRSVKRNSSVHKRIPQISAPLANQRLNNEAGALKVEGLTDELKALAGAPSKEAKRNIGDIEIPSRQVSVKQSNARSEAAFSVVSAAPVPPPHTDILFRKSILKKENVSVFQGAWKQYLSAVLASRIKLRQEVSLFQLLLANQPIPHVFNPTFAVSKAPIAEPSVKAESSRRWSASVAEIKSHRASIVPEKYISSESESGSFLLRAASSLAPTAPSESPSRFTESNHFEDLTPRASQKSSERISIESISDNESTDERIEKLQQVLNRRSMLGEMLDYDSDDIESVASSMFSKEYLGEHEQSSEDSMGNRAIVAVKDSPLITRYGTLNRRPTYKSSYYGSSNESEQPSETSQEDRQMTRSPGIQNLQYV